MKMINALWGENPQDKQFGPSRGEVTVADLKGPGIIRMIHFALPGKWVLDRALLLRIYWDGEEDPSVDCPLVDFFLDPNGAIPRIQSALVNKNQGWNAYFPMPFRQSARIVLTWEAGEKKLPGSLWHKTPCYSYVMYETPPSLPENIAYFHAKWQQKTILIGKETYEVFRTKGQGHLVGWSFTTRGVHPMPEDHFLPVDMNVKIYVDGSKQAEPEYQGIEDAVGFSWGFPKEECDLGYTGWHPYYSKNWEGGYFAYRFCVQDRIPFSNSVRMTIAAGDNEAPWFARVFGREDRPIQMSTVAYWYQQGPHEKLWAMPPYKDRLPGLSSRQFLEREKRTRDYRDRGVALAIACGHATDERLFLEKGYDIEFTNGGEAHGHRPWIGAAAEHCWSSEKGTIDFAIHSPVNVEGTLRIFMIDPDRYGGGRKQAVIVAGRDVGTYDDFVKGRWVEIPVKSQDTADGKLVVSIVTKNKGANAVISHIEFLTAK
jgi:hypothetical protein